MTVNKSTIHVKNKIKVERIWRKHSVMMEIAEIIFYFSYCLIKNKKIFS